MQLLGHKSTRNAAHQGTAARRYTACGDRAGHVMGTEERSELLAMLEVNVVYSLSGCVDGAEANARRLNGYPDIAARLGISRISA